MVVDEFHYALLRLVEATPVISQRAIARAVASSVGKVNLALRSLVEAGLVERCEHRREDRRIVHAYRLTPRGVQEKSLAARQMLARKSREYEQLRADLGAGAGE